MNMVRCSLGCEHPACEICGTSDQAALINHDYWPFGVRSTGRDDAPTMTSCLDCRNAVFARIDTVGKVRLLIGLEQRVTVPPGMTVRDTPVKPAIPDTDTTQVLPVSLP